MLFIDLEKERDRMRDSRMTDEARKTMILSGDTPVITSWDSVTLPQLSVKDLLSTGVINLNKPMGPTSHQVSAWVKNIFGVKKMGHGGTLDPRVTGVLPMAFGKSTRFLDILTFSSKEYVGVMRLHADVPQKKVEKICREFVGPIYQLPPVRSAVKRQTRVRKIYSLDILEQTGRDILFKVICEAGTYIRSLVNDIGLVLGKGAHMQELRRTRSGCFRESDSITLHDLKDAWVFYNEQQDESLLRKCIKPMEILLSDLPKIIIHDSAVSALCHGAELAVPGIIQFDELHTKGEPVAIFSRRGEGVALGETVMLTDEILNSKSGIAVKTRRVVMSADKYQRQWKTKERD